MLTLLFCARATLAKAATAAAVMVEERMIANYLGKYG
jgi:hypothetical protein